MAKIKLEVKGKFSLVENNDTSDEMKFSKQIKKNKLNLDELGLELVMIPNPEKPSADRVGFSCTKKDLKSGKLEIKHSDNRIDVDCDAVFQLGVRDYFVNDIKSNSMTWLLSGIENIGGPFDITGLEQIIYKYFNRRLNEDMTEVYSKIDVKSV